MVDTTANLETTFQLRSLRKPKDELQELLIAVINSLSISSLSTELPYRIKQDFFQVFPERLARFQDWYIDPQLTENSSLSPDLRYGILSLSDLDEVLAATARYISQNLDTEISNLEKEKRTQFFQVLATLRFSNPAETQTPNILLSRAESLFNIVQTLTPQSDQKGVKELEKNFPIDVSGDAIQSWNNGLADFTQQLAEAVAYFKPQEQIWNSIKLPKNEREYSLAVLRQGYNIWLSNLWVQNAQSKKPLPGPAPRFQIDTDNTIPLNENDLRNIRIINEQVRAWIDSQLIEQHEKESTVKLKVTQNETAAQNNVPEGTTPQPSTTQELIELTRDSNAYRREVVLLKRILIPQLINLSLVGLDGTNLSYDEIRMKYPVEFAQLQDSLLQEINNQFLKVDVSLWKTAEGRKKLTETITQQILFGRKNTGLLETIKRIQVAELDKRFENLPKEEAVKAKEEVFAKTDLILDDPEKLSEEINKRTDGHQEELHSKQLDDIFTHFESLKTKSTHLMSSLSELGITSQQQQLILNGLGGGILEGNSAEQFRFLTPDQFNKIFGFKPSESLCIQLSQIISDNYPFKVKKLATDYKNSSVEFNNNPKAALILSHPELDDPNLPLKEKQKILNSIGANWSVSELDEANKFLIAAESLGGIDSFFYITSATQSDLDFLKESNPAAFLQVEKARNFFINKKIEEDLQNQARYLLTLDPLQRESAMKDFGPHVQSFYAFKKTIQPAKASLDNLQKQSQSVSPIDSDLSGPGISPDVEERLIRKTFYLNNETEQEDVYGYAGSLQAENDRVEEQAQRSAQIFLIENEEYARRERSHLTEFYQSNLQRDLRTEEIGYQGTMDDSSEPVPNEYSSLHNGLGVVKKAIGARKKAIAQKATAFIKNKAIGKTVRMAAEKIGVALFTPVPVLGQIAAIASFIPPKLRKFVAAALGIGALALLSKIFSSAITAATTLGGALAGFAVAGPVGAVVGGTLGYFGGSLVAPHIPQMLGGSSIGSSLNASPPVTSVTATPKPPFLSTPGATATAAFAVTSVATTVAVILGSTQQAAFLPPPLPIDGGQSAYVSIEKKADPGSKFDQPQDITYTISITPKEGYTLTINDIRDTFSVQINTKKNAASSLTPADSPITLETLKSSNGGSTVIKSGQTVTLPAYTEKFDASYHDTGVINTVNIAFTADDGNGNTPIDKSSAKASVCFGDCPLPPTGCWPTTGTVTQLPYDFRTGPGYDHGTFKEDAWDIGFGGQIGRPIYAPFSGKACSKAPNMSTGWEAFGSFVVLYVTPDNGNSAFKLYFAHLLKYIPELEKELTCKDVLAGDIIGYGGASGHSTGPHLHYEYVPGGNTYADSNARKIVPDGLTDLDGKLVTSCYDTNASK